MTVQIRKALPKDAAQLLDLIRQHALFERATECVNEADLVAILDAREPPTHLIVAEDERTLIGYAALTFDYALWTAGRFAHLDCLFVYENARGQGIGKQLFDHVGLLTEEAGVERMEWQTPLRNLDAIRFASAKAVLASQRCASASTCVLRREPDEAGRCWHTLTDARPAERNSLQ